MARLATALANGTPSYKTYLISEKGHDTQVENVHEPVPRKYSGRRLGSSHFDRLSDALPLEEFRARNSEHSSSSDHRVLNLEARSREGVMALHPLRRSVKCSER